eukprot:Rhum_TRINITY_DN3199_c0_g1::Rhum_TRINITY_DN3199_c0_g1_i1::g.9931::m.9931
MRPGLGAGVRVGVVCAAEAAQGGEAPHQTLQVRLHRAGVLPARGCGLCLVRVGGGEQVGEGSRVERKGRCVHHRHDGRRAGEGDRDGAPHVRRLAALDRREEVVAGEHLREGEGEARLREKRCVADEVLQRHALHLPDPAAQEVAHSKAVACVRVEDEEVNGARHADGTQHKIRVVSDDAELVVRRIRLACFAGLLDQFLHGLEDLRLAFSRDVVAADFHSQSVGVLRRLHVLHRPRGDGLCKVRKELRPRREVQLRDHVRLLDGEPGLPAARPLHRDLRDRGGSVDDDDKRLRRRGGVHDLLESQHHVRQRGGQRLLGDAGVQHRVHVDEHMVELRALRLQVHLVRRLRVLVRQEPLQALNTHCDAVCRVQGLNEVQIL